MAVGEPSTPDEAPEPRYERFLVRYPSGTVIESCCFIGGGATLREVAVAHPLAVVAAIADSRVGAA
jgi:hypothetical protein